MQSSQSLRELLERLEALERSGGAAIRVGSRLVEVSMYVPDLVVIGYVLQAGLAESGQFEQFRGLFR